MQRIYLRRRIVAAAVVLVPVLLIIFLLTRGGGSTKKVSSGATSTTRHADTTTTTTLPLKPVASVASWHLPIALSRSVVLPVNTEIGVFGGQSSSGATGKIYQIDPMTGQATALGTMPVAVHDAGGAVVGSSYYVFGGLVSSSTATATVQQFSFANSTTMTGSKVGTLPVKRAEFGTAMVNNEVYLVGGFDGSTYLPSIVTTSDGMTFTSTSTILHPAVRFAAVAAQGAMLYVIGGEIAPVAADSTAVQEVNLQSGAVTQLTPLHAGLSHAAAVILNNTIYVLGGRSGGHAIATISAFNPATGALTAVGTLPAARSDMGVTVIGQTAYLMGGEGTNGQPVNSVVTVSLSAGGATSSTTSGGFGSQTSTTS
ncbi:MAG TPA: hypothetical protein VHT30_03000 [Acidimicrobiales bacterium]|jgi:hypothetical protein|nr:hypothetical protein [Acidimicrobiales bacterium]